MKKFTRLTFLLACTALFASSLCLGKDVVIVKWNASVREYCHVLGFSTGWQMPKFIPKKDGSLEVVPKFRLGDDYEFRVSGLLSTKFLVRGVEDLVSKRFTTNIYEVDLSDPKAVARPASEEEWTSATVIPLRYMGPADALAKFIQSLPYHFVASGQNAERDRLSPDRSVLVFQSWSGKLAPGGSTLPGDFTITFGHSHGKLFFDVFDTATGKNVDYYHREFRRHLPRSDLQHNRLGHGALFFRTVGRAPGAMPYLRLWPKAINRSEADLEIPQEY